MEVEEDKAIRYIAKAADGSMRDALAFWISVLRFIWETLTYDQVLEVLGAVDTEVFSNCYERCLRGCAGESKLVEELVCREENLSSL